MEITTPQSGVHSPSGSLEHTRVKAAIWAGVDVIKFCEETDPEWQAKLMAHYIFDQQLTAVLQQDSEQKARRRNNRHTGNSQGRGQEQE